MTQPSRMRPGNKLAVHSHLDLSANLQHSVECHARPAFYAGSHLDLVDDAALNQVFEGPGEVLRADAIHRGAEAAGIIQRNDLLALGRELLAHAVDQVDFGANSKLRSSR